METLTPAGTAYPSDVSDEGWDFVAPSLALMDEAAPRRRHALREAFDGRRLIVRTGMRWRMMPRDLPPRDVVSRRTRRWTGAGCFEAIVHGLRALRRLAAVRGPEPTAAILDSRTLQPTPESGGRAGYDGATRRKGSKTHVAVDAPGHLLALHVTPADDQDRAQLGELAEADAAAHAIRLAGVKHPAAKRGFVLTPRRWVVERGFAWVARFRRLAKDYERLSATVVGLHFVAFACLLLHKMALLPAGSP